MRSIVPILALFMVSVVVFWNYESPTSRSSVSESNGHAIGSASETIRELELPVENQVEAIRIAERKRRPVEPSEQLDRESFLSESFREGYQKVYERLLDGHQKLTAERIERIQNTSARPPTNVTSIEAIASDSTRLDVSYPLAHKIHLMTNRMFQSSSGFGFWRMIVFENSRGIVVADKSVDRVELVSLLLHYNPCVYVLDETPTPALARVAKRRDLDQFEKLGLDAVRNGVHLVWTPEAPKRMFGAIRAEDECIECHAGANEGDLLGAFTYFLDVPVNELTAP